MSVQIIIVMLAILIIIGLVLVFKKSDDTVFKIREDLTKRMSSVEKTTRQLKSDMSELVTIDTDVWNIVFLNFGLHMLEERIRKLTDVIPDSEHSDRDTLRYAKEILESLREISFSKLTKYQTYELGVVLSTTLNLFRRYSIQVSFESANKDSSM